MSISNVRTRGGAFMVAAMVAIISLILGMTAVPTAKASDLYPFHTKVWVTGPQGDDDFTPPASIGFKFKCEANSDDGSVMAGVESVITVPQSAYGNENTGAEPTPHPTMGKFPGGTNCVLIGVDGNSADVQGYTLKVKGAEHGYGPGVPRPLHGHAQGKFPVKLVYEKKPEPKAVPLYVTKKIDAPAEGFTAPASIDFKFQCTMDSLDGSVKANQPATGTIRSADYNKAVKINDFPEGTDCMILEEVKDSAKVAGFDLVVTGNFNETKRIHNNTGYDKKFWIQNTYTKSASAFKVAKKLGANAPAEAASKAYEFGAKCTKDGKTVFDKTITVTGAGESELYEVPVGAECTVTEDKAKAAVTGYNLDVTVKNSTFTVGKEAATAEFTNTYDKAVSAFKVAKKLGADAPAEAATKAYEFGAKCTKDGKTVLEETITVTGAGESELYEVPVGAECTVTEDKAKAAVTGYNLDVTVKNGTFTVGKEAATAEFTNTYAQKLGKVSLTKVVTGLAAGSSFGSSTETREFTVEASWKDAAAGAVTKTYTLTEGVNVELPALPVGTQITIKEILPDGGLLINWGTPSYSADAAGVVKDNGDGTAVITVPSDEAEAAVVTVTNTKNIPWWLIVIPLIPLAIIPFLPKPQPPAPHVDNTPAMPTKGVAKGNGAMPTTPAPMAPAPMAAPAPAPQKQLAQTGASVIGLALFAALIVIAGAVLIGRARKNEQ